MDIQYVGEHLFPGHLGRLSLILAFVAALFSIYFYYKASGKVSDEALRWRSLARKAFWGHSIFITLASIALMYILLNRYYEYRYVWVHVENDLGLGYMIAAFWAGQEGSLLFWTLCQVIFGLLLLRYAKSWENPVMVTVSLSQAFMTSMLLGIYIGSVRIGMSPFLLLREVPETASNAFFQDPNYLALVTDGNGLNPLLRNFWMMSHPPVLFIGFAAALIPFAYVIAGLWKRKYTQWIQPSLPWTLLTIFFLGAGILLGGVWAYESLTFGGFWAWDPIENASLVPWVIIVAALHLMLIARKKEKNVFPAMVFTLLAFVFVVYSTYLTRSGVLAETSVHSFGKDGMGPQIMLYIFTLLILGAVMLIRRFKQLPDTPNEDVLSREFWLFIASMVLVLSAFQVIFTTSIPVINLIFSTQLSPPAQVIQHYNTWQMPFAIFIAILMGVAHYIQWGKNKERNYYRQLFISLAIAAIISLAIVIPEGIKSIPHIIFLFAGIFACVSSLDMLIRFRNKLLNTPAIISHLGMALFFIAILLTFHQQETISKNTSGQRIGSSFSENENLLLIKDSILPMGDFYVSYRGNEREGEDIVYHIDFMKQDKQGEFETVFVSQPTIKLNERMGNVYNPYAKIYLTRDIFTYISYAEVDQQGHNHNREILDEVEISVKDTISLRNNKLVLNALHTSMDPEAAHGGSISIEAELKLITHFGQEFNLSPRYTYKNHEFHFEDDKAKDLNIAFRFKELIPGQQTILLEVYREREDFIIIKTIVFPYINLLWISCIVMLTGFWMTYRRRWKMREKGI